MVVRLLHNPYVPTRWTIVFHRRAENRFFSAIAMGHFKHVSAFAFVPDLNIWIVYDVSFRRTHFTLLSDANGGATPYLAAIMNGNCLVSMTARDGGFPLFRFGLYCTTAIKHLLGLRGGALRPDALFRLCVREGGTVSDDASQDHPTAGRPQPCQ